MISQYFLSVSSAPETSRTVLRTVLSISSKSEGDPSSLPRTSIPHTISQPDGGVAESAAQELGMYGMSTPSYEPLESQLQSPNVVIQIPLKSYY
jgi:hypothetical protein